jgi:CRP/FNR family transcriptional regulator
MGLNQKCFMNIENPNFIRCLEVLKESLIFKAMETSDLRIMLQLMTKSIWNSGSFKSSGDFKSTLHFIVSGRVKEYQINPHTGREHTIFILSHGDIFDILRIMDSESHDVYWEAIDEMEILSISWSDMKQWLIDYPLLNSSIIKYLGTRIRKLEEVATDISLHNTLIRLSHLLLNHINEHSHKLEIIHNLPNTEIASLIGTTRAVVNRHIQELKKCGAISVSRSHIDIENIELLLSIAEEKYTP